jgi:hypothetical protein
MKRYLIWLWMMTVGFALDVQAKKIVCVAPPSNNTGDGFLNSAEGYERSTMKPGDVIVNCNNPGKDCLKACIEQAQDGDELVIIAHGLEDGEGFVWGNDTIRHFIDENAVPIGPDELGLNTNLGNINNVKITFKTCYSNLDDPSLPEKLGNFFGDNVKLKGFTKKAYASACLKITVIIPLFPSLEDAVAMLVWKYLESGLVPDWTRFPPANRNGVIPNQQSVAQDLANQFLNGLFNVTVEVFYKPAYEADNPNFGTAILNGKSYKGSDYLDQATHSVLAWELQNIPTLQLQSSPDELCPPAGFYKSPDIMRFYVPENKEHIQIRNLRFEGFTTRNPLLPPAQELIVPNPLIAYFEISNDDGHSFTEIQTDGFVEMRAVVPDLSQADDTLIYALYPVVLSLNGLSPFGTVELSLDPSYSPRGVAANVMGESGFESAGYFSAAYLLHLDGAPTVSSCVPVNVVLTCASATAFSCTDPAAHNYNPCALQNDGSCEPELFGCTYPDANNYQADATIDDGSCLFSNSCLGDLDGNWMINVGDVLILLAAYGSIC